MSNALKLSKMKLLSLPQTKAGREGMRRRNINHLGLATASHAISYCGIDCGNGSTMLLGKPGKVFPVLNQLVKMSERPYVIVGTHNDIDGTSFYSLEHDWELNACRKTLPDGNGIITLNGSAEELLSLKEECLPEWDDRLIIICLGGIRIDYEMIDILSSQKYMLITDSLHRCTRASDGHRLLPQELISEMDYIVCAGASPKEMSEVLPKYDCEKLTNTTDFSVHDDFSRYTDIHHHGNGKGFRLSQSRTVEEKPILSQNELICLQDNGISLFYNAKSNHVYTAKIVR